MKIKDDKILFIGDIAGRKDELVELCSNFPDYLFIAVGDLQDRGSQSKEVLDFIMSHPNFHAIFGNHEELFLDFIQKDTYDDWFCFLIMVELTL